MRAPTTAIATNTMMDNYPPLPLAARYRLAPTGQTLSEHDSVAWHERAWPSCSCLSPSTSARAHLVSLRGSSAQPAHVFTLSKTLQGAKRVGSLVACRGEQRDHALDVCLWR